MPLPSFFQRLRRQSPAGQASVSDATPLSQIDIEASRTRARRRLIGMVVLVLFGVVGFPWLFETQPRPLAHDVQIVQAGAASSQADLAMAASLAVATGMATRAVAGKVVVAAIVPQSAAENAAAPQPQAASAAVVVPTSSRTTAYDASQATASDAHAEQGKKAPAPTKTSAKTKPMLKARAKPEPPPEAVHKVAAKAPESDSSRYIVQIGAFVEVKLAHEARMKVERAGIKTYTQVVSTPAGRRIRVRIGPYANKAEADKAMAKLHKAGLSGSLLTL